MAAFALRKFGMSASWLGTSAYCSMSRASCQLTLFGANFLSSAVKNAACFDLMAGSAPYAVSSSSLLRRNVSAWNASSGCFVFFMIANESAWSFAVVVPLYAGGTAMSQFFTSVFPSAGMMQHVYQRWTQSMATLPDWNGLPLARRSESTYACVGTKWSFHMPS